MKKIKLSQGQYALVDNEDYEWLNQWQWHYNNGYAKRAQGKLCDNILMHRLILEAPSGFQVDHINRNRLDNRRTNLRIATQKQNLYNKVKYKNNTSGFRGIVWYEKRKKWGAGIRFNGKRIHIGMFHDIKEAAKSYDKWAKLLFKEYAVLNFPPNQKNN